MLGRAAAVVVDLVVVVVLGLSDLVALRHGSDELPRSVLAEGCCAVAVAVAAAPKPAGIEDCS